MTMTSTVLLIFSISDCVNVEKDAFNYLCSSQRSGVNRLVEKVRIHMPLKCRRVFRFSPTDFESWQSEVTAKKSCLTRMNYYNSRNEHCEADIVYYQIAFFSTRNKSGPARMISIDRLIRSRCTEMQEIPAESDLHNATRRGCQKNTPTSPALSIWEPVEKKKKRIGIQSCSYS